MEKSFVAKAHVLINADRRQVWKAITDPEIVKQYFFGTRLESDWQLGGKIRFRGEWNGKAYEDKGTILAIEPERLLRFDYWSNLSGTEDLPENYVTVTYELSEEQGGTTVVVLQDRMDSAEARDHSQQNWLAVLEGLKGVVETGASTRE